MCRYQEILNKITLQFLKVLANNLVGIYMHGSIAFNCFNWEKSDIDFIVVINNKINHDTKLQLLNILEELRVECPPKGLEMSVVLKEHCKNFKYPTPYELHFSNGWLNTYLSNPILMCSDELKIDKDLAAHFTVIRRTGIVLCGLPVKEVFGNVESTYYCDSIKNDVKDASKEILDNPIYIILNLCRILAYLKDNLVVSKKEGGEWGLSNLKVAYHPLIQTALKCYSSNKQMDVEVKTATEFSKYMLHEIQTFAG
jgi:predicted nucleotidyltransferase